MSRKEEKTKLSGPGDRAKILKLLEEIQDEKVKAMLRLRSMKKERRRLVEKIEELEERQSKIGATLFSIRTENYSTPYQFWLMEKEEREEKEEKAKAK